MLDRHSATRRSERLLCESQRTPKTALTALEAARPCDAMSIADHPADAAPSLSAGAPSSPRYEPVAGPSRVVAAFGDVEPERAAAALWEALMAVAIQLSPTARTRAADALDVDGSKLSRRGSVRRSLLHSAFRLRR